MQNLFALIRQMREWVNFWPYPNDPVDIARILQYSEIHVKCPKCGEITVWCGTNDPPIRCYSADCNQSFIRRVDR